MSDLLDILGFGDQRQAPPAVTTNATQSLANPQPPLNAPTGTLADARKIVREGLNKGITCPCCDQFAKRYKLKLSHSMSATLCWMHANFGTQWVHIPNNAPEWVLNTRSYPKMVMWGLIESKPKSADHKGRTSGVWRVTPLGTRFVKGLCEVPRYVYNYNGNVDEVSRETTDIHKSLGDHFEYSELMAEAVE